MRPNDDYVALRRIPAPGTLVNAYQRGDGVSQSAVDNWEMVIGEDVAPLRSDVVARPTDDGSRADWVAYDIGQGMDPADAEAASLDDLIAAYPEPAEPHPLADPTAIPDRPADSAKKDVWIAYVVALGADEEWANAGDTTKTNLMEWEKPNRSDNLPGDPLAVSATEQANG